MVKAVIFDFFGVLEKEGEANSELLDYIRSKLKPKYKLGIISNTGADWISDVLGPKNKSMFEDIILSYQVDFIKPETEIYEMSLKNLGVKAEECVFIDDISTYCQGAENIGMNTIWYRNFAQMKTELEKLLTDSNN